MAGCQVALPVRVEEGAYDVLTDIRRAVGTDALFSKRDGLTFSGVRMRVGGDGRVEERPVALSMRPSGSFMLTSGFDDDVIARGFDGADAWSQSGAGLTRVLSLGARESQLTDGWLRAQLWLMPGTGALVAAVDDKASDESTLRLAIERPGEPIEAFVDVDRATMLPKSFTLVSDQVERVVVFDDWRLEDGVAFPAAMIESIDGRIRYEDRFERRVDDTPPSFGPPLSRPTDATFRDGSSIVPAKIDAGGRYYAQVSVDGTSDLWMLVDTGFGAHAIDDAAADRASLKASGATRLNGVGGADVSQWRVAELLTVGPLDLSNAKFATIDTRSLSERAGFQVDGVLGAPLFERAAVVLDPLAKSVTIKAPGRIAIRAPATWQPLARDGTAVCVRGSVVFDRAERPLKGWFRLDTGSDDTLTVSRWAAKAFGLARRTEGARTTSLVGLFGTVAVLRMSVPSLEAAGLRVVPATITVLREETRGPLADPWIAGNLGMGMFAGRRVVIDAARGRVAVE